MSDCKTPRDKLNRNVAWLRSKLPIRGTRGLPGRKAMTNVEVGWATTFEKTRIMHKPLKREGIESLFALGQRHNEGPQADRNHQGTPGPLRN